MEREPKTLDEREQRSNLRVRSPEPRDELVEIRDPATLTPSDVRRMSPAEVRALQRTVGNQAVARLLEQREGEDEEEEVPGPRDRAAPPVGLTRFDHERESPDGSRGLVFVPASGVPGDAINVDGENGYGWNRLIDSSDVASVVRYFAQQEDAYEGNRIVIISGTHGLRSGNLVDVGAGSFVGEDQATADEVMADPDTTEGTQIQVIDVHSYGGREELADAMERTDVIKVFGWCYSSQSYANRESIKANWWSEPDHLPWPPS